MSYINPYKLLGISFSDLTTIDLPTINRAKRKLLSEIELSDTASIMYYGIELNKSDCLKVIDELDNKSKKDFHLFLFTQKHLSHFLTSGDLLFFDYYQAESIYTLPEFIDFISPFFASQYDKSLLVSYKRSNHAAVSKILSINLIVNTSYYEKCYKSTYTFLKSLDNDVNTIIIDIKNNKSSFIKNQFIDLEKTINSKINVSLLNLLPSYFQNLRNQLALSIRNLAVVINNDPYKLYKPAYFIVQIANTVSTDALTKQIINKGFNIIQTNYENDIIAIDDEDLFSIDEDIAFDLECTSANIEDITKNIEDGTSVYISSDFFALDKLVYEIVDPISLNLLSGAYQVLRNQIGDNIRSLARVVNFKTIDNQEVAYKIISIALLIHTENDIEENIANTCQYIKDNYDKKTNQKKTATESLIQAELTKLQLQIQVEANKQIVIEWNSKAKQIETISKEIEDGISDFIHSNFFSLDLLISQLADPLKLNSLPHDFQDQKNQIAANILSLSTIICNTPYFNSKVAFDLINIARNINIDGVISSRVSDTFQIIKNIIDNQIIQQRLAIKAKHITVVQPINKVPLLVTADESNAAQNNSKNNTKNIINLSPSILVITIIITLLILFFLPAVHDDNKSEPLSPKNNSITPPISPIIVKPITYNSIKLTESPPILKEITYHSANVPNGNLTGCSNMHSQYDKSIDNKLIIACGSNADAAVKIIDNSTDKSIRYIYIKKNTSYTVRNIPEGLYYLKIAYGSDWVLKGSESNCGGRFTTNAVFKKGDEILDYHLIHDGDGGYQVPSFSLKLNITYASDDNMKTFNTNSINENDFYNE